MSVAGRRRHGGVLPTENSIVDFLTESRCAFHFVRHNSSRASNSLIRSSSRSARSIEAGKLADIVLLDTDPLQDIHNTMSISGVFLSGRYLDRVALDKLLKEAEAAANSISEVKAYVH